MKIRVLVLAGFVVSLVGFTQSLPVPNPAFPGLPESSGVYQIRYLANLDKGDSYINFTNAGTLDGRAPAGNICVNVYTFDPAEELISCCACLVTPNGLNSLSARNDLIGNTLTPGVPTSIAVKLLSSLPVPPGNTCNPSSPAPNTVVRGMRAWASTLHLNTSGSPAVGYQQAETPFSNVEISGSEGNKLVSFCSFIQTNGSGFGICKSCRFGALGADRSKRSELQPAECDGPSNDQRSA